MKTISEFTRSGPEIKIGEFTLRQLEDGTIWIEKADGEGMQTSQTSHELCLISFYEENF